MIRLVLWCLSCGDPAGWGETVEAAQADARRRLACPGLTAADLDDEIRTGHSMELAGPAPQVRALAESTCEAVGMVVPA